MSRYRCDSCDYVYDEKDGDPREILTRLKAEREPAYAQAPIRVMSSSGPQGRTVARC